MAESGLFDYEDSGAARPFWSGKPPFYWFVLISSLVLLALFPFQLTQILRHSDTVSMPGWFASSSPSGWIVSHVPANGPAAGKLHKGDKLLAINGDTRAARTGSDPFLAHMAPG